MISRLSSSLGGLCLACALLPLLSMRPALAMQAAPGALPPTESFFQYPAFSGAKLSPNGRHIGFLASDKGSPVMLVVADLATRTPRVLVKVPADVAEFRWVSDKRLAYTMTDRSVAPGDRNMAPGLFAVDIDGSETRQLANRFDTRVTGIGPKQRLLPYTTAMISSVGRQDGDTIYVNSIEFDRRTGATLNLLRLDTRTGESGIVRRPGRTTHWVLDEQGEPRVALTQEEGKTSLHFLDPASKEWQLLHSFDARSTEAIMPISFGPDGKLYVIARRGSDKAGLYTYDIAARTLSGEPLVSLAQFDFSGAPVFRNGRLAGVHYTAESPTTVWFDADMQKLQKLVDEKLPATNNRIVSARRGETPWMLVHASSDAEPGATWLLNGETGELSLFARALPGIDARLQAPKDLVRFKARDGLEVPAWLTLPRSGQKKLPLVVLAHGGPWVRGGMWAWDSQVQFLASRGYAVLEPEFRGSTGYGFKHFSAGFKQWGQAMQDDVADAARWAVAQGIADPQRICVAGASYGGYAALMGVVKDADLFKCAVSWVGVTDINLLYDLQWSDSSDEFKTFGLPQLVGDQKADAAMLRVNSPLERAAEIRRPLLLAYGMADRRVPLEHGTRFHDAVKKTNPAVEWITYDGEAHGWALVSTRVDFWNRVDAFLGKHIGPQAGAPRATP